MQFVAALESSVQGRRHRDGARPRTPAWLWLHRLCLVGVLVYAYVEGGPIVRAAAISCGVLGLIGDRDGATGHLLRWAALAAATVVAAYLGPPLAIVGAAWMGISQMAAALLGPLVVGVAAFWLFGRAGVHARRRLRRRPLAGALDRMGGSLVGSAEGALLVAGLCWALAVLDPGPRIARAAAARPDGAAPAWLASIGALAEQMEHEPVGRVLMAHNPLQGAAWGDSLRDAFAVLTDPGALSHMMDSEEINAFASQPAIKRHVDAFYADAELRRAVEQRDLTKLMWSAPFQSMISDPEVFAALKEHWPTLTQAVQSAVRNPPRVP